MPIYQILFHGSDFHVQIDDDVVCGFYTARRQRGSDPRNAFQLAYHKLRNEPKTAALFAESREAGSEPILEMEKIYEISIRQYLFSKYPKGFIFYQDSDD